MLPEIAVAAWVVLIFATIIAGMSKTALPGAATIPVAIFASVLPARESTAVLLVLFIVGDVVALWSYRSHADWSSLVKLAPAVVIGLVTGAIFLGLAEDVTVRRVIGIILLLLIFITLWRRRTSNPRPEPRRRVAAIYGALGGFTTMVANAGGSVMSMYFLAMRFPVKVFLGTAAWFFAVINLTKVPFAIGLGLLTPQTLLLDLALLPAMLIGAFAGRLVANRINQRIFEQIVIVLTIIGAIYLLI
ncbi:MAG: sulfite exporter TauE/SafE family protein [Microbacteriaceae bacterium]|nr:sulfite exporter TauE/SafE family protein [Microbacteriaceae bacterium]